MRLFFLDGSDLRYTLDDIDRAPLGGSQSAMILAAHGLAARGHTVGCAGIALPHRRESRGVMQYFLREPKDQLTVDERRPDLVVVLNNTVPARAARGTFGGRPLAMWMQNDVRSLTAVPFADATERDAVDLWIFVSKWQRACYLEAFAIRPERTVVIANPIAPPFLSACLPGEAVLAHRDPDLLVYASAPNRGLRALAHVLPTMRRRRPRLRLEVYSGFLLDMGPSFLPDAAARNEALLAECAAMPGVTVHRGLDKPALARRLRNAALMSYPSQFRETSCIAVLEAMAAGCLVSTTAMGALPETTAGFAALTPVDNDTFGARAYVDRTLACLDRRDRDPAGVEAHLRLQVEHVRAAHSPAAFVDRWEEALRRIVVKAA